MRAKRPIRFSNASKEKERISMPYRTYEEKIEIAKNNIFEWYEHWEGKVYVAFSGGKDSTVVLDLVRRMYPEVPAVYYNTGLEYPEIRKFVKSFDNVTLLRPKKPFTKIIKEYGYPVINKEVANFLEEAQNTNSLYLRNIRLSKTINGMPVKYRYLLDAPFKISDKCCDYMKKEPAKRYVKETGRQPYVGLMASDSENRLRSWKKYGCNAFDLEYPIGRPIMSWETADVWRYIKENDLRYCSVYDEGEKRTGCMFCAFGVHLERNPNRFERMRKRYPKLHKAIIHNLGFKEVLDFLGVKY